MKVWVVLIDMAHPHEAGRDLRVMAICASKAYAEDYVAAQNLLGFEIQEWDVYGRS